MATVPQLSTSRGGNAVGSLANPVVGGNALALSVAEASDQITGGIERFAAAEKDKSLARDNLSVIRAEGEFIRAFEEGKKDIDMLSPNSVAQVQELATELTAQFTDEAEFENIEGNQALAQTLAVHSEQSITTAMADRDIAVNDDAMAQMEQMADATIAQIIADPDGAADYIAGFGGQTSLLTGAMTSIQIDEIEESFADAAALAQVEGLAQQGRFDEAQAFLRDNAGSLDANVVIQAGKRIREVETQQINDRTAGFVTNIVDFQVNISDATDVNQLGQLRVNLDAARDAGMFEGRESAYGSLVVAINSKLTSLATSGRATTDAFENFLTHGVETKGEANLVWDVLKGRLPEAATTEDVALLAGAVVQQGGMLPSEVKTTITAGESSRDPTRLAEAALFDLAVKNVTSGIDTGVGPLTLNTQALMDHLGMNPQEAAEHTLQNLPADEQVREQRETEAKDALALMDFEDVADDILSTSVGFISRQFGGVDATVPVTFTNAMTDTFTTAYLQSGDEAIAMNVTAARLTQTWGVSNVGGVARPMEHPPERFVDPLTQQMFSNLPPETMTAMLNANVQLTMDEFGLAGSVVEGAEALEDVSDFDPTERSIALPSGTHPDEFEASDPDDFGQDVPLGFAAVDTSGLQEWILVADDQTTNDLTFGGQASYLLLIRNRFGGYDAKMIPGLNVEARWTVPTRQEVLDMEFVKNLESNSRAAADLLQAVADSQEDGLLLGRGNNSGQ